MNVTLAAVPAWAALVPLGCYLVVLGWLHLRCRPAPVSGSIDLAALAAAVSGFVLAGPLALVQPAVGTAAWATLMMVGALVVIVAGGLLATRPRLVIYNVTVEQLRPLLAEVVGQLDGSARWAGESVVLPAQGLQVLMDGRGIARCVSIVAVGSRASPEAWADFARRVRRAAQKLRVRRNLWGGLFLSAGLACLAVASAWAVIDRGRADDPVGAAPPLTQFRPFPSPEAFDAGACRSFRA